MFRHIILAFVALFLFAQPVFSAAKIPGPKTVAVKIYSDYACRACAFENEMVKSLRAKYGNNVTFNVVHYPFTGPNSVKAAMAAEAAKIQDKFWEMHDKLLASQTEWATLADPQKYFLKIATELGLDTKKFVDDMESETVKTLVESDTKEAKEANIAGTPIVFINDKNEGYIKTEEEFEEKIIAAANEKSLVEQINDLINKAGDEIALAAIGLLILAIVLKYRPELTGFVLRLIENRRDKVSR